MKIINQVTDHDLLIGVSVDDHHTEIHTNAEHSDAILQATQAAVEAETNEDTFTPPDLLRHSPGVAKAWINFEMIGAFSINASYNVSSLTDNGVGIASVFWDTDFSSADYSIAALPNNDTPLTLKGADSSFLAGSIQIRTKNINETSEDSAFVLLSAFGDQ